jgi:hypothetical protein
VAEIFAVVRVATPTVAKFPAGTPTTGALPSDVVPAKNVTVPVGALPKLCVETVAASVKFVLAATLVGDVVIVETVGACVIVNGTLTDVLAL